MLPLPSLDRLTPAPLPLSQREQQVCDYLSQRMTFEAIARHLSCSPAAARAYHRRALSKRQRTIALAPLEQGESYARRLRNATAKPEPALAKQPCDRPASPPASICKRSPFHSPAVGALALRERPSSLDLCVPSLFVMGESVTTGQKFSTQRSPIPQTTTTEAPCHPRRRKSTSRRFRWAGVGDRVAELGLWLWLSVS